MFAREANSESVIRDAVADAVFFKVDCEKGEGPRIAEKYNVHGYPTFYALNGEGEPVERWIGYGGAEAWTASVAAAKADRRTLAAKKTAYEAEPTLALARSLASDASTGYELTDAVGYLRVARDMDDAHALDYTTEIVDLMSRGADRGTFTYEDAAGEVKAVMGAPDVAPDAKVDAALMMVNLAKNAGREELAAEHIEAGLAAAEMMGEEHRGRAVTELKINHALIVTKDEAQAVALRKEAMPEGWMDDAGRLNGFAWWCFENDINLEEAEAMAVRGVELAEDDADQANILDTLAEICNALGNCDEALTHIKRAIELSPDRQYFKDQLVKFEAALKEKRS